MYFKEGLIKRDKQILQEGPTYKYRGSICDHESSQQQLSLYPLGGVVYIDHTIW